MADSIDDHVCGGEELDAASRKISTLSSKLAKMTSDKASLQDQFELYKRQHSDEPNIQELENLQQLIELRNNQLSQKKQYIINLHQTITSLHDEISMLKENDVKSFSDTYMSDELLSMMLPDLDLLVFHPPSEACTGESNFSISYQCIFSFRRSLIINPHPKSFTTRSLVFLWYITIPEPCGLLLLTHVPGRHLSDFLDILHKNFEHIIPLLFVL